MAKTETFPEHDQSADSPVSVLKRMNGFESLMKINNVFESRTFPAVIFFQKYLDLIMDIFRVHCIIPAYLVWQFLVIADTKP